MFPIAPKNGQNLIGDVANKGVGPVKTAIVGGGNYTILGGGAYGNNWPTTVVFMQGVTGSISGFEISGAMEGVVVNTTTFGMATISSNTFPAVGGATDTVISGHSGANIIATSNMLLASTACSIFLVDLNTKAALRGNYLTSDNGWGVIALGPNTGLQPTLDAGTVLSPGNNTIIGGVFNIGLYVYSTAAASVVNVSGNTWKPNIQGADALGHYAAGFAASTAVFVGGNNYANIAASSTVQFFAAPGVTTGLGSGR